ncbi:MAG: AcrR family transcriptional regulator [Polyangiales bacterium]|jgi:AcrR family transcriptional regulator
MARLSEVERRESLLAHGAVLFAQQPVDSLPMAEIAAGAGCSKGLLYHYFGSRRGYYVAVLETVASRLIEEMRPEEGVSFDEAFEGSVRRFLKFARRHPSELRLLVRGGLGVDAEAEAVLSRVRNAAGAFVLAQLEAAPTTYLRIALGGWVSFAESSALAWVDSIESEDSVDDGAMLQLLVDALQPVQRAANRGRTLKEAGE